MVKINNLEILKRISEQLKVQQSWDRVPDETGNQINLCYNVNDDLYYSDKEPISRNATATDALSATVYATDPNKTFYLTSVQLSIAKDVSSPSTVSNIAATINGVVRVLIQINTNALIASTHSENLTFPYPIRIDKGTNILVQNNSATANIDTTGVIGGFLLVSPSDTD